MRNQCRVADTNFVNRLNLVCQSRQSDQYSGLASSSLLPPLCRVFTRTHRWAGRLSCYPRERVDLQRDSRRTRQYVCHQLSSTLFSLSAPPDTRSDTMASELAVEFQSATSNRSPWNTSQLGRLRVLFANGSRLGVVDCHTSRCRVTSEDSQCESATYVTSPMRVHASPSQFCCPKDTLPASRTEWTALTLYTYNRLPCKRLRTSTCELHTAIMG